MSEDIQIDCLFVRVEVWGETILELAEELLYVHLLRLYRSR